MSNNAAPANVIAAKPAIGTKSPVFAVFAFVVVLSCPVWIVLLSVDEVSVVFSTDIKSSIAARTFATSASTSSWVAFSFSSTAFASFTAAVSIA